MPLTYNESEPGLVFPGLPAVMIFEEYENDDADIFFPKKGHRKAIVNATTATRRLYYLEESIRRSGNVALADILFGIRCTHIRAMTALFVGRRQNQMVCVESHFEERRKTVPRQ